MSKRPDPNRSAFGRVSFSIVLALLATMILIALLIALNEVRGINERTAISQSPAVERKTATAGAQSSADIDLLDVTPPTPWQPLDETKPLTRIGFGSCLHQNHPMPIWENVIATEPDLFVMLGDNVYGDIKQGNPNELARTYLTLGGQAEFALARARFPFLAIWDDHDYGTNDGGANYRFQPQAAKLFRQFWGLPDAQAADGGIYFSRLIGQPGKRVQLVFLDVRTFKSPFARKDGTFPYWGKYKPDPDTSESILGESQWAWLRAQLRQDADIRIIASGIQFLANGHGWERWGNLPKQRAKLLSTIQQSEAGGVILVSGDRHAGAHYQQPVTPNASGQTHIPELTASSMNRSFGPSQDARLSPLVSGPHHVENFGLIEIDWAKQRVTLALKGLGDLNDERSLSFVELGAGRGPRAPARP